ncbi:MAG: SusC/RagA family TonB-linked outer membrane protein [Rikenellaceae bacterium]
MVRKLLLSLTAVFGILLVGGGDILAQNRQISGSVSTTDGSPIAGATVMVVDSHAGTTTGSDGSFRISAPGNGTLEVSYIGYESQEVAVAGKTHINITLEESSTSLDDVVVVAYGTAKKESVTGSISVVGSESIEKRITTSVTGALEGAAPGVQVNNTYGEPGSSPSIRIRGFGSVNGTNAPLYVLDGVPFSGNISEINPADIASISILKDAASSALYGNRAANGVVLITTKKGSSQKPQIQASVNFGTYNRGIAEYDRMGTDEWMETAWIAMKNYGMNSSLGYDEATAAAYATENIISGYAQRNIYDAADNALFDSNGNLTASVLEGYDDLDWQDNIIRSGIRQEYSVSGSASSDKYSIFSSVGYLNEQGYVVGTLYERYTARINSTYKVNKWLETGINLSGASTSQNYNSSAYSSYYSNPFYMTRYMAPIYPLYLHNEDGSYLLDEYGEKQFDTTSSYLSNRNIAYELREDYELAKTTNLNTQAFATVTLPAGFSFTVKGDLTNRTYGKTSYDNPDIGDGAASGGRLTNYSYDYTYYTAQQLLNWNKTFDLHNIEALVGHENYSWERSYTYGMNTGMSVEGNYTMGNFTTNSYYSGSDDAYRTESYLARARYNYDSRYFLEASFRRDGSSRFAAANRWGNFYSVGASWNMKAEDFLKDVSWVDYLKFRTAWGEVGNDAGVGYYAYMALYDLETNGGDTAFVKYSLDASDIQWETTQTFDIGFEGRLFDRVDIQLGYFDKRSKDLLFDVNLPLSAGSNHYSSSPNLTQTQNIGSVSNRGVELSINANVMKKKDFSWNVGFDATFLKNKIVTLPDGEDILDGLYNYSEGHSIYEFYTYHFEGVDQMTGRSLYTLDPEQAETAEAAGYVVNVNGVDYVNNTTYALKDWAGTALPTVYGSFSTDLHYKNVGMNLLFTYSLGGYTYDSAYKSLMSTNSMSSGSAYHVDLANSWNGIPDGMTETSADRIDADGIPAVDFANSSDNNAASDRWLVSSSYLVLKNLNFYYTLPSSLAQKIDVSSVSITAGVENLFTLTARQGLNPQYSFDGDSDATYVTARVYSLGLKINF